MQRRRQRLRREPMMPNRTSKQYSKSLGFGCSFRSQFVYEFESRVRLNYKGLHVLLW
jgi:hypothetical protein